MDIGMEAGIFLAYSVGLLVVYFFGRIMLVPLKKIMKLLLNSVVGGACILAINVLGTGLGIVVPINIFTAICVGILGVPGAVAITVYFNWIF